MKKSEIIPQPYTTDTNPKNKTYKLITEVILQRKGNKINEDLQEV